MIKLNDHIVVPTKFPDGTTQVWKLPAEVLDAVYKADRAAILWDFESEAELLHVAQLKTLLDAYTLHVDLDIPFLPYGRQDKLVSNETTFGLRSFARLINAMEFANVYTLDAHNNSRAHLIMNLTDRNPRRFIFDAVSETESKYVVLPDAGAALRYGAYCHGRISTVTADKVRDQKTGWITSMTLDAKPGSLRDEAVIIVDDLCDGGLTFILLAKALQVEGAKDINLYVTHGIFSKGLEPLYEAGIKRIFTHKGEVGETKKVTEKAK